MPTIAYNSNLKFEDIKYPFITNYYDDSIVCYSFSKSLSLPGERIGYVVVGRDCENANFVYDLFKNIIAKINNYYSKQNRKMQDIKCEY